MGRPISEGFTYFSHDVDMSSDEKIELLEARHDLVGYAVFCKLLERIFRAGGCFDISLKETPKILSNKFKVSEITLNEIILSCVEFGLFDKEMYEKGILTSRGIAKRAKPLYDNRLNNRGKEGEIVLTEMEKQFYSYIKTTPKLKQKKYDSIVKESKVKDINNCLVVFAEFRNLFGGSKRGNETEFKAFQKHSDWEYVLPQLINIIKKQIESRRIRESKGEFVPSWKNLKTWIHQRCWEEEITDVPKNEGNDYAINPQDYIHRLPPQMPKGWKPSVAGDKK